MDQRETRSLRPKVVWEEPYIIRWIDNMISKTLESDKLGSECEKVSLYNYCRALDHHLKYSLGTKVKC